MYEINLLGVTKHQGGLFCGMNIKITELLMTVAHGFDQIEVNM